MKELLDSMDNKTRYWAVADAKARFSEVLRCAREQGPQRVGTRTPCIIVSEEEWLRIQGHKPKIGEWLIKTFQGVGELELPPRAEPERPSPFAQTHS